MIAVIGTGIMGETFVSALIAAGVSPQDLVISEKDERRAAEVSARHGVRSLSPEDAAEVSDTVIIAVKPGDVPALLDLIGSRVRPGSSLVSVAAGITLARIEASVPAGVTCVRAMPNTPAVIGEAMTVISASESADARAVAAVRDLLASVGQVAEVPESLQDSVTAISGSGPAYVFAFMEALEAAAIELGLDAPTARALVLQTVAGAALLARSSEVDPAELRRRVTSPGGTTQAALEQLREHGLDDLIRRAARAARDRSIELGAPSPS